MDTTIPATILNQTHAAAEAQVTSDGSTNRQDLLHENEGNQGTSMLADDPPPPAYGEIYGEVHGETDGLGTSARVTDDGRVNIRINQLNRRLSMILTPALRQQINHIQEVESSEMPSIPAGLGGDSGRSAPPRLNVVMHVVGSRGDVQPFIALGKVLKNTYGHRVRLATHPNFKQFVEDNGLEFFNIGGDPSLLMAFMVKNPKLMPGLRSLFQGDVSQRRKDVAEYVQGCWRSCYEAGDGCDNDDYNTYTPSPTPFVADCIIANPPSFAHVHCAEKLGIPLHIMFTMPYSPTQAFPHPLANIQSSNADAQLTNYMSYAMIEILSWQGLGDIINRFRKKCLGLDPVSLIWAPGTLSRLRIPHTYCWSPALIPKPKDWGPHISVSGFYFLDQATDYTPSLELQAFLDAGSPPIYIGFGSIVLDDPDAMTELILDAVHRTKQRVLLSQGWGGIGADKLVIPENVFMLGNVPHDWLFKHVSCVVHHGGAGTTSAGIAAGRPTVIIPFFGDQPFWGAMVSRAGAGPDPIPFKGLTSDRLADAINFCLRPESQERARQLAKSIASEHGTYQGADFFHQRLNLDRLRCTLAPSRAAVWRIKGSQVRLSAFAACALSEAKLLDFQDLKLYRSQEHETDEGPWDPVTGGAAAVFGAMASMSMGVLDLPAETVKVFYNPDRSGKARSKTSSSATMTDTSSTTRVSTTPSIHSGRESIVDPKLESSELSARSSLSSVNASANESTRSLGHVKQSKGKMPVPRSHDITRSELAHTNKGLGRIVKSAIQAPMDMSMSFTKGFHNMPKMWGDDTVRPQEQVTDLKTGLQAAGKEFGFGMYDGITGLVTQPWKGAQKEGASGFLKGFGKGVGGLVVKPGAALFGLPGYFMKGIHKQVQKTFGGNVQNYIIAIRAAQGYDEWLQSSDEEKEDVIARFRLIQKYLKRRFNADEMMQDVLDTQQASKTKKENQNVKDFAEPPPTTGLQDTVGQQPEDPVFDDSDTPLGSASIDSEDSLVIVGQGHAALHEMSAEHSRVDRTIQETVSHIHRGQLNADSDLTETERLRLALAASEDEARRHAEEAAQYQKLLRQALERSMSEQATSSMTQRHSSVDIASESASRAPPVRTKSDMIKRKPVRSIASSSRVPQAPPSYDPGHLDGITQSEFEAQQQGMTREKTAAEKTEEEIVLEYIKKQSLLEQQHHSHGRSHDAEIVDDENDEDLQQALKLSLQ